MNTSEIAKIAGVHANTVRNYEKWHLISPVQRKSNGYRDFNEMHLNQVLLVKKAFFSTWLSGNVRNTAMNIVKNVANKDFKNALVFTYEHFEAIQSEKAQAVDAVKILENYNNFITNQNHYLPIGKTSNLLDISIDMLRDWERNNLITVPRGNNGYRLYGEKEINRLKIIKVLRKAKYSMMIIMKMLKSLDDGKKYNYNEIISSNKDVFIATDNWLKTLEKLETNAKDIINHLKLL